MIPVVNTERLVLRGHTAVDFDGYAAFWAGDRSRAFGGPFSRRQSWDSFLADAGQWLIRGFGQWIVALKQTGAAIGWAGFVRPDHDEETELGWTLFDGFEGQGFAYEASLAARRYGAEHFGITTPVSNIAAWNARSLALAERLGAVREDTRDTGDGPFHIYRHPAPERAS